jgi:glucose/mannose transport system permease protein
MSDETFDHTKVGKSKNRVFIRLVVYTILIAFVILYLLPIIVVVLTSVRSLDEIYNGSLIAFPAKIDFSAWTKVWRTGCVGGNCKGIAPYFYNSLELVIPATIISTAIGAINGYALTKWKFRGSEFVFAFILFGVFLPNQLVLLPWAWTLGKLGIANSTIGLVTLHCVCGLGFVTLFCRNYFLSIPDTLIKAARIDGAGFWTIFRRIILPLSPPILVVVVIWQFTHIWNEYLFATTFTSGYNKPITAALMAMTASQTELREYNVESAAVIIAALPTLLIYFFAGRFFMRGLTAGSIKG